MSGDYSFYVWVVYGLALVVYGGATLVWRGQLSRNQRDLAEMEQEGRS